MHVVGYSNVAQKTLESNAILWWQNILGENIGQDRCTKKWKIRLASWVLLVVGINVVLFRNPVSRFYRYTSNNKAQINTQAYKVMHKQYVCHGNASKQIIR